MISTFANPHRFMSVSKPAIPILFAAAALLIGVGVYQGLFVAPADYRQGDAARIMFVHVPAAWVCMAAYASMAAASFSSLVWRHNLADLAAKSAAPAGAAFTLICLATGSLWGKPIWNTWWEWDARMTSVLVLFFLYLGYMAIWRAYETPQKAARAAAILCLVGAINLPIIKFSVDWWSTLHQPASVLRADGPSMPASYLTPLLTVALGYLALFLAATLTGMRAEVYARRAEIMMQRRVAAEG